MYPRFPSEKSKYLRSVGRVLPRILGKILLELGFGVWVNPQPRNGVDIEVYDKEGTLVLVVEILNWSPFSWMSPKRKKWITDNLRAHNCRRLLVYTAMSYENILEDLSDYNISLVRIGYQVLTKKSYRFFEAKNQVIGRKTNSRSVKRDIKSKVVQFLESSDIHA